MAETTNIAWCDSTFNPWIGCTKVGPGCDHCYAAVSTPARAIGIKWGPHEKRHRTSKTTWNQVLKWNKAQEARLAIDPNAPPWRVFCASLADVFDNEVPWEWREDLWTWIELASSLSWLIVTKRVGNVADMVPEYWMRDGFPPNVRLLITVVSQEEAERDIPKLLALPCKNGISYEPALAMVDFSPYLIPRHWRSDGSCTRGDIYPGRVLEWIIVGGESDQAGHKARPFDIGWAESTIAQCKAANVPVFMKQIGSMPVNWCSSSLVSDVLDGDMCDNFEASEQGATCWGCGTRCVYLKDRAGADPTEWPADLRVQEFPA